MNTNGWNPLHKTIKSAMAHVTEIRKLSAPPPVSVLKQVSLPQIKRTNNLKLYRSSSLPKNILRERKPEKKLIDLTPSIAVIDDNPVTAALTIKDLEQNGIKCSAYVGDDANRDFLIDFQKAPGRFIGAVLDAQLHPDDIPIQTTIRELRKLYVRFIILTGTRPTDQVIKDEFDNGAVVLRNDNAVQLIVHGLQRSDDVTQNSFEYYGDKPIGEGGFGEVWWVKNKANQKDYAMKIVKLESMLGDEKAIKQAMREKEYLLRAKHNRIVPLISSFKTSATICFLFPLAPWGDLQHYLATIEVQRVKEDTVRGIVAQIVEGIDFLHSQGICHRDIKQENVLVTIDGDVQLCDFGCSALLDTRGGIQGTPVTWAPEIVNQIMENPSSKEINVRAQSDWWAIGILAHELLVGKSPFDVGDIHDSMILIALGYQYDELPPHIGHLKNTMKKIFTNEDKKNTFRKEGCYELAKETKDPPLHPMGEPPVCPKITVAFPGKCGLDDWKSCIEL